MSMHKFLIALSLFCTQQLYAQDSTVKGPGLGQAISPTIIKKWDMDIFPNGEGLPEGNGNAHQGQLVYE